MPIKKQGQNEAKKERRRSGWDEAISDAKRKIKGLQFSISIFRQRKRAGEPWPGGETQN
jgi:hypothetical protein